MYRKYVLGTISRSSYNYSFFECHPPSAPLPWQTSTWYLQRGSNQATGRPDVPNLTPGFERPWFRRTKWSPSARPTGSAMRTRGISSQPSSRRVERDSLALCTRSIQLAIARRSPSLSLARASLRSYNVFRLPAHAFPTLYPLPTFSPFALPLSAPLACE